MAGNSRPLLEAILISNVGSEGVNLNPVASEGSMETKFRFRKGGLKNYENMQMVFAKGFGFKQINACCNMNTDVLVNKYYHKAAKKGVKPVTPHDQCCLKCLIKAHDFSQTDCFLFCISTHGFQKDGESFVKFLDGPNTRNPKVNVNNIIDLFSDANCPTLAGKPRILIFDACRSDKKFPGNKDLSIFNLFNVYISCKCT